VALVPSQDVIAIPKSIAYDKIDDASFQELHRKVVDFMRSERATQFLWPHLTSQQQGEMIETILGQFEEPNAR
jgi:hypothetical protein